MQIWLTRAPIPRRILQSYFIPSHRADRGGCAHTSPGNAAAHYDAGVRRVVNQVVRDCVSTALPGKNTRRRPVQLADVMYPIVDNLVFAIHIFGAWPITGQKNADAA